MPFKDKEARRIYQRNWIAKKRSRKAARKIPEISPDLSDEITRAPKDPED